MKKLFVIFVTLIVSVYCYGQNELIIGINSGITLSTLKGEKIHTGLNYTYKTDYSGGLSASYTLSNRVVISSGLNYINIGPGLVDDPMDGNEQYTTELNVKTDYKYLSVPLSLNYNVLKRGLIYISAGVNFNFLISAKVEGYAIDWFIPYYPLNYDFTDDYRKLDLGIKTGVGTFIWITKNIAVNIDMSFNRAVLSTNKGLEHAPDFKYYNQYFNFIAGISYKL